MSESEQLLGAEAPPKSIGQIAKAWWVVVLLMVCTLVAYTGMLSLNLLVDPIKSELGISDVQFSLLQGAAYIVPVAVSGVLFGFLADRYSRRYLLIVGLIIWGIGTVGCGMARDYAEFALARGLLGFGKGALVPVAILMVSQVFAPKKRGKALGLYFVGIGMGPGIGIWIAGIIYEYAQTALQSGFSIFGELAAWRVVFIAIGLPALILLPLVMTMADARHKSAVGASSSNDPSDRERNSNVSNGILFACIFTGLILVAFTDNASISWIPSVFTRQFGYSIADAGAVFAIIAIGGGGVGPLLAGWTSDKIYARFGARGRLAACAMGSLILSILYLAFLLGDPQVLLVALVGVAILVTGIGTVGMVVIQEFLPERIRGFGTGLTYSLGMLIAGNGATVVAIATDYLYSAEKTGLAISTVCAPIALAACLILLLAVKITHKQNEAVAFNSAS